MKLLTNIERAQLVEQVRVELILSFQQEWSWLSNQEEYSLVTKRWKTQFGHLTEQQLRSGLLKIQEDQAILDHEQASPFLFNLFPETIKLKLQYQQLTEEKILVEQLEQVLLDRTKKLLFKEVKEHLL